MAFKGSHDIAFVESIAETILKNVTNFEKGIISVENLVKTDIIKSDK